MNIGPVLHLTDVIGTKVAALAIRAYPPWLHRVGADSPLSNCSTWEADPALSDDEFAAAMARLDALDDSVFAELYGLTQEQIETVRAQFADWPRR